MAERILTNKTCGGCKHFFKQQHNPSECHRFPPRTNWFAMGMDPKTGGPHLHSHVSYDFTHDGMEACGEYVPKLAVN